MSFAQEADAVTLLGQQVNLLWIIIGAVLVIFMQAGFALVETGFCRAKHAAHVVVDELRHLRPRLRRLLPRRLRLRVRRRQLRRPTSPATTQPLGGRADRQRQLDVPLGGRLRPVAATRITPGRARLVPLHGRLHGHRGHHPDRLHGRAVEVEELRRLGPVLRRHLLPAVRGVDLGRRLARQDLGHHGPRRRLRRLRRLRCRPRRRRRRRPRRCHRARPPHRQVRQGRQGRRHPRPPHPDGHARHVHPAVRLVRLQRRLDLRRHRRPVRHGRRQHGHRRCLRRRRGDVRDDVAGPASPTRA